MLYYCKECGNKLWERDGHVICSQGCIDEWIPVLGNDKQVLSKLDRRETLKYLKTHKTF